MLPLPDGRRLDADEQDGRLSLRLDAEPLAAFSLLRQGPQLTLSSPQLPADPDLALWVATYWLFAHDPGCEAVHWNLPQAPAAALRSGLLVPAPGGWLARRDLFWQLPQPWLQAPPRPAYPQTFRVSDGRRHPLRPPKPSGELYRRFDARLGQQISLRTLDIELDLERFNRWQNTPRVLHFWQEGGTPDQHRAYLQRLADDPHTITVIGCFDDEPFAYFELYWAKEDRIAPFYDADDYDRGIHMLVGEPAHRGPHKVSSWLPALTHYLFLDDPRTRSVVAEPRADNANMINYLKAQGFSCEKEFDFPHKRAALMILSRDAFFDCRLLS